MNPNLGTPYVTGGHAYLSTAVLFNKSLPLLLDDFDVGRPVPSLRTLKK